MGLAEWPSSICAYMYIQQKQAVPSLIDTLPSGEEKQKLGQKGGWLKREKPDLFLKDSSVKVWPNDFSGNWWSLEWGLKDKWKLVSVPHHDRVKQHWYLSSSVLFRSRGGALESCLVAVRKRESSVAHNGLAFFCQHWANIFIQQIHSSILTKHIQQKSCPGVLTFLFPFSQVALEWLKIWVLGPPKARTAQYPKRWRMSWRHSMLPKSPSACAASPQCWQPKSSPAASWLWVTTQSVRSK